MASWKRVAELFRRLEKAGLDPKPEPFTAVRDINWSDLPPTVDSRTLLSGRRLDQKRDQVANLLALINEFPVGTTSPECPPSRKGDGNLFPSPHGGSDGALGQGKESRPLFQTRQVRGPEAKTPSGVQGRSPRGVVVDFGAGSGHLALPVAYLHPEVTVWLVDLNEYGLGLARERAEEAGLDNVRFFTGKVAEFEEPFDIGFALHACGEASDEAQERCLACGAAYVVCPCDLGKIQNADHPFPRSARFRDLMTREEYNALASAADWTNVEEPDRRSRGARAMAYVNLDRNLAAEEVGYDTLLLVGYPLEATPKNQIIYGSPATPGPAAPREGVSLP